MVAFNSRKTRNVHAQRKAIAKGFDPMVYALHIIKNQFDNRAYLTHDDNGNRIIRYALVSGTRIILGHRDSNLVYERKMMVFTEQKAKALAYDMGAY